MATQAPISRAANTQQPAPRPTAAEPTYVPVGQEDAQPVAQLAQSDEQELLSPLPDTEQVEHVEANFTEAPALVYSTIYRMLYDENGYEAGAVQFNLTARAMSAQQAIDELVSAINYAGKRYGFTPLRAQPPQYAAPQQAQQQPPTMRAPSTPPVPAMGTPARAPVQAPPVPANQAFGTAPQQRAPVRTPMQQQPEDFTDNGEPMYSMLCVQLEVKPRSGDARVDLGWCIEGHRYSDINMTVTPQAAAQLLAATGPWTEAHFQGAVKYPVRHRIFWKPGRQNQKGGTFKDIVRIEPF